eukprot:4654832-Amphidinium_carterae.1
MVACAYVVEHMTQELDNISFSLLYLVQAGAFHQVNFASNVSTCSPWLVQSTCRGDDDREVFLQHLPVEDTAH